MYIYNITFGIDPDIEAELLDWLRTEFISAATGTDGGEAYFSSPELMKVLTTEPSAISYALHLRAIDKADINNWYADYGSRLFSHLNERWAGKAVFFTTTLETVD